MSGWQDSNLRPLGPKPSVLSTELHPVVVEVTGLEPACSLSLLSWSQTRPEANYRLHLVFIDYPLPVRHFWRVKIPSNLFFAVHTGFEPAPHTVTGWYCYHSTNGPFADMKGFEPSVSSVTGRHVRPLHHTSFLRTHPDSNQDLPPRTGPL